MVLPETQIRRAYRFRLDPTPAEEATLARFAGTRRFAWNYALARRRAYYAAHGRSMPKAELSREMTAIKDLPDTSWLRETPSQIPQQAVRDLDRAFEAFFEKRSGFPKFKSRKRAVPTFRIPQNVRVEGGFVSIPKLGRVRLYQSQQIVGEQKGATFKRESDGHWYVSIVVEQRVPDLSGLPLSLDKAVGLDGGLRTYATLSTGDQVENPRFLLKTLARLRRVCRQLSRRRPGSSGWNEARRTLARLHAKVARQRLDWLHKLTTELVRLFDVIAIEDLSIAGMAKTKLARSIYDASLATFRRQLEYKAEWLGKAVVAIDRWSPSSKRCHACGEINAALSRSDTAWRCPTCGTLHEDRDLNAAHNILEEGLRVLRHGGDTRTVNARGARVSPALPATGVEAGIHLLPV